MMKGFTNQMKKEDFQADFLNLKKEILEGTASETILLNFRNKMLVLSGDEAIKSCLQDIYQKKRAEASKKRKYISYSLGVLIFISSALVPFYKSKNKKPVSQNTLVGKAGLNPAAGSPPEKKKVLIPQLVPDQLNFCGELVPMEDKKISKKFSSAIYQTRFTRLESKRLRARVKKWFPIITPILKQYNIPEDFKYIPIVETGFANSVSNRGAGGFWQLMEGTARQYGLKVNDSTDERKDVRRCTIAACRYLRDLHKELGSWTLTAAAYNMGPGGLMNKMDDQNHRDYYRLHLNSQTSKYVYKTLAYKQMLSPRKRKQDPFAG